MPSLRELRVKRNISLRRMAESTGLHRARLSEIETGQRTAKANEIVIIAHALDLDPLTARHRVTLEFEDRGCLTR